MTGVSRGDRAAYGPSLVTPCATLDNTGWLFPRVPLASVAYGCHLENRSRLHLIDVP